MAAGSSESVTVDFTDTDPGQILTLNWNNLETIDINTEGVAILLDNLQLSAE